MPRTCGTFLWLPKNQPRTLISHTAPWSRNRSSTSVVSVSYQSNCVTNLLTVFAVAEEEEIANHCALEVERVERCQRCHQHEEEEAEDCTPEHVNQDEDELDHDDEDNTIVRVN